MIPFFVLFNYHYVFVKPMFNSWMLLDVAGSCVILATCLWGLTRLDSEQKRKEDQAKKGS